jgi:hypothetical protein
MASTREKLIDWLADLPDNTEIGIEDIYLVAMVGNRAQDSWSATFQTKALTSTLRHSVGNAEK